MAVERQSTASFLFVGLLLGAVFTIQVTSQVTPSTSTTEEQLIRSALRHAQQSLLELRARDKSGSKWSVDGLTPDIEYDTSDQDQLSHRQEGGNEGLQATGNDHSSSNMRQMPAIDLIFHDSAGPIEGTAGMHAHTDQQNTQQAPKRVPLLTILSMTTFMALMSGFGAVPFFIFGKLKESWAGIANAVACGVMLAASFDLLHEGAPYSPTLVILGMVVGGIFIKTSQDYLSQYEDASFEDLQGADARKALLIIGVMAAHAFGEGSGVGVSFSGNRGWAQGTLVTIAIGLHNIPEGMAVATVMVSKGATPRKALFWTLFCSIPQAIVAVPSYLFVESFSALLPLALGFAAGCMVWIVFAELIPDALEAADHAHVATAATFSAAWLQGLSMLIATLEDPNNGQLVSPVQANVSAVLLQLLVMAPGLLLAPCIAAGVASSMLPSAPITLGAAVGVTGWLASADLLQLLLQPQRQSVWVTLACAVLGALSMMLMWAAVCGKGSRGSSSDVKRSLEPELAQAAASGGGDPHGGVAHSTHLLAPHHYSGGHIEGVCAKRTSGSAQHHLYDNGHGIMDGAANAPAYHNGGGGHWEPYHHEMNGSGQNGFVALHLNPKPHALGAANGRPCACDGCEMSTMQQRYNPKSDLLGGALLSPIGGRGADGFGGGGGSHRLHMRSAMFAVAALAAHGVPAGMSLAHSVISNAGVTSHLMLPLTLGGLPLGLAAAGLGRGIFGVGVQPAVLIAGVIVSVTALSSGCALLSVPLGVLPAQDIKFDVGHWTDKLQAAMAGALLLAACCYMWPAAAVAKERRARTGVLVGLLVGCAMWMLQTLLCLSTPYCMGQRAAAHAS